MGSSQSSARSTSRRAVSMDGGSWRSKCATIASWIGCTEWRDTTGSIRTRSISRTKDCWPTSRTASRAAQRSSPSTPSPRMERNDDDINSEEQETCMSTGNNSISDWVQPVRAEYLEMPGLHLPEEQVQRLGCLDPGD